MEDELLIAEVLSDILRAEGFKFIKTASSYSEALQMLANYTFDLAFLDVFQEDKFNIPSTSLVKKILTDMSIFEDFDKGLTVETLSNKYNKSQKVIQRVIDSREVI